MWSLRGCGFEVWVNIMSKLSFIVTKELTLVCPLSVSPLNTHIANVREEHAIKTNKRDNRINQQCIKQG